MLFYDLKIGKIINHRTGRRFVTCLTLKSNSTAIVNAELRLFLGTNVSFFVVCLNYLLLSQFKLITSALSFKPIN